MMDYFWDRLVNMVQDMNDRAVKNIRGASRDINLLFATNTLSISRQKAIDMIRQSVYHRWE